MVPKQTGADAMQMINDYAVTDTRLLMLAEDVLAQAWLDGEVGVPEPSRGDWEVEVAWTALRLLAGGVWPRAATLLLYA